LGNLFAITYGNGQFLGVGGGFVGFTEVATSPDGITWNSVGLFSFTSLVDVAYGNGRFLGLGLFVGFPPPSGPEFLFESPDGSDWTLRDLPTPGAAYGLIYANSRYYAVGDGGLILESGSYLPGCLEPLGLGTNGFDLRIIGEIGRSYRLQASTDAGSTNWQDVLFFTNPIDQETVVTDPRAQKFSQRYYRLVSP